MRHPLIFAGLSLFLVACLLSYSQLDFEPGAWVAAILVFVMAALRTLSQLGALPDFLDLGDDGD